MDKTQETLIAQGLIEDARLAVVQGVNLSLVLIISSTLLLVSTLTLSMYIRILSGHYSLPLFAAVCFVLSNVAGARGVISTKYAGFTGKWKSTCLHFNLQSVLLLLGVLALLVAVAIM